MPLVRRNRGRPAADDAERKNMVVNTRMSYDLYERAKDLARYNGVSLSEYLRLALLDRMERDEMIKDNYDYEGFN